MDNHLIGGCFFNRWTSPQYLLYHLTKHNIMKKNTTSGQTVKQRILNHTNNKRIEFENVGLDFSMENPFNDYDSTSQVYEIINERIYFMDGEVIHISEFTNEKDLENLLAFIEDNKLVGKKL